jgi:hypothetical protein
MPRVALCGLNLAPGMAPTAPAKTRTKTAMTMTLVALSPANSIERLQRDPYSEA